MRKLSEIGNEGKLDIIADILEPMANIMQDKEIAKAAKESYLKAIQAAIRLHKKEVIEILARIDGVPVKDYKYGMLELPFQLVSILQDGDVMSFFGSQALTESESSTKHTANTEASEQ
jgi:hypothetical protein